MKIFYCILLSVIVSGCYTIVAPPDFSLIEMGMSKAAVVTALGKPDSMAAQKNVEYLIYDSYKRELSNDANRWNEKKYFVRLVDGKVESYGEKGDFGTTRPPPTETTIDLNIEQR